MRRRMVMCPWLIGDMQVIAPASFVRMKGVGLDDHDNKWDEDADSI